MPLLIGLMSGTSADGVDAALVQFDREVLRFEIGAHGGVLPIRREGQTVRQGQIVLDLAKRVEHTRTVDGHPCDLILDGEKNIGVAPLPCGILLHRALFRHRMLPPVSLYRL